MRLQYVPLFIMLLVNILVDGYIYVALHSYFRRIIWSKIHLVFSALLVALFVCIVTFPVRSGSNGLLQSMMWMVFTYLSIYFAKYVFVVFDVLSRIPAIFRRQRWHWMSVLGAVSGFGLFALMWWGALFNRYNLDVRQVDVVGKDIPQAFDGFKIAQISDLHLGTFGSDTSFVCNLVGEINALNPDMVVFTGDLVNRKSAEAEPFIYALSKISAKYGVYSVLGNHDYGDYADWDSPEAKEADVRNMVELQKRMGWRLLNNECVPIARGRDTLMVIGVENVGDPPFHSYGDLAKAYATPGDSRFTVLLSHNPAHYDLDIQNKDNMNVSLTLSGHTHAMQAELFGWSPCVFRYKHWGGMYTDSLSQRMYVNIGAGTVGMPARIGATPEITLLTLRCQK